MIPHALFTPEHVAVITDRADGPAARLAADLAAGGFHGRLEVVCTADNAPRELAGCRVVPHCRRLETGIDTALLHCGPEAVMELATQALDAGARGLMVLSGGFKETGPEGAALEERLAELCRHRDIAFLGPNSMGVINSENRLNTFIGEPLPPVGGVSIISESSSVCAALLDCLPGSGLGAAKVVNLGNKAGVSEVECLRFLAHDGATRVIVGYLESITNGDAFVKAAEEAALMKPVILLKGAVSVPGRRAVAAHSGELVASETAYGAAFKRAGVVRADTFGALFDFAAAFSMLPLPAGRRTLVITNAGGAGIMAVDALDRAGLEAGYLDQRHLRRLAAFLPPEATIYNPLDILGDADGRRYCRAITEAAASPRIDAVLVLMVARPGLDIDDVAAGIVQAATNDKPVLVSFLGRPPKDAAATLHAGGVPLFNSPEHAVAALAAMWEYVTWRRRPPRVVTRFRVNRRRVERVIARSLRTGGLHVSEVRSKTVLQAYDFAIPPGAMAASAHEAVEAARLIGFPVAMKIVSPDISHKSAIGGVRLNIPNRAGVVDAYDLMMLRVRQKAPQAFVEGVYIERMLDQGLEFVLGMRRDPQFGPMLMFGLGGIFVEVLKDVAFHLAPITHDEARQMLESTRSYAIMRRSRGEEEVDLTAMAVCLQKVSQLATDFPMIEDLEINLMMQAESGRDPQVADARMTLSRGGKLP